MKLTQDDRPDKEAVEKAMQSVKEKPAGLVPTAAFSVLKDFEECPYRVYLSKVMKHKRPTSDAAERGNQAHDVAENYIRGEGDELPLPKFLEKLPSDYLRLRRDFEAHPEQFCLEDNWGFDINWNQTGFFDDNCWLRQKLDVFQQQSATSALIVDHKSGKKWGNELKHGDQGLQYAIGAMKRIPTLQFIETRFYYIDKGEKLIKRFTRPMLDPLIPRLETRILKLTTAQEDELQVARPTPHNCRFCPHKESGNCEVAA